MNSENREGMMIPHFLTFDFQCRRCGTPLRIPIHPEFDNPAYVMGIERQHGYLREHLSQMEADLMALARECLDAGVKPEIMRRADELRETIREWLRILGKEPRCDREDGTEESQI